MNFKILFQFKLGISHPLPYNDYVPSNDYLAKTQHLLEQQHLEAKGHQSLLCQALPILQLNVTVAIIFKKTHVHVAEARPEQRTPLPLQRSLCRGKSEAER